MSIFFNSSNKAINPCNQSIKIQFNVKKRVLFGEAIYLCGDVDQLGNWRYENALKLEWTKGDIWTGAIFLQNKDRQHVEYKYFIDKWNNQTSSEPLWQVGQHNRNFDLKDFKNPFVSNDVWNLDILNFIVGIKKQKGSKEERYYLVGEPLQLGNCKERKQLKKISKKILFKEEIKQNTLTEEQHEQMEYYCYSLRLFRSKYQFKYLYLRKNQADQRQIMTSRYLNLNHDGTSKETTQNMNETKVLYINNEIFIIDHWRVNQLNYSQITPNIFVGSYIKSIADVAKLKQHDITSVLAIQSDKDYLKHGLSAHYCQLICNDYDIQYKRISIQDMNTQDFINKSSGALKSMADILKKDEKVYVHCSAGIFRSTQLIALYLTLHMDYSILESVRMIQKSHPKGKPNLKVLTQSLKMIKNKNFKKIISI